MSRQLYERWLIEGAGATLSEFVAEERARWRQIRAQRRLVPQLRALMQQAPQAALHQHQQQMAMQQGAPLGMYWGKPIGWRGIGGLLGGRWR